MTHRSLMQWAASRRTDYITGWEENKMWQLNTIFLIDVCIMFYINIFLRGGDSVSTWVVSHAACSCSPGCKPAPWWSSRFQSGSNILSRIRIRSFCFPLTYDYCVSIPAVDHHFPIIATWEAHMVSRLHFWSPPVHSCLLNECLWFVSLSLEL